MRAYIIVVALLGLGALLWSGTLSHSAPTWNWAFFALLAMAFANLPIVISLDTELVLLTPLTVALIFVGGPLPAIIAAIVGVASYQLRKHNSWEKSLFNTGSQAIEAAAASLAFVATALTFSSMLDFKAIAVLILSSLSGWIINALLFSGLLSIVTGDRLSVQLRDVFKLSSKHVAVEILVAILFVSILQSVGQIGLLLMAALLVMVKFGFQAYYQLRASYEEVQTMLISILDARDAYTAGHSIRVAGYAAQVANELKLPPREVETLRRAALLHDIGKVNVPDHVLKKPGKLSDEETAQMNQHPADGARFVEDVSSLRHLAPVIRHHHERLDGGGYPDGLNGEDIPFGARVLLVADAFDAMTTDRPYRRALTRAEALRRLAENAGTQFDPKVAWAAVRVFGADLPEYAEIREVFTQGQLEAAASRESILGKGRA